MNKSRIISLSAGLMLVMLAAGCRKQAATVKTPQPPAKGIGGIVSAEMQEQAKQQAQDVWQKAQFTVPANAAEADREFYLDLAALTQNPNRLAGMENGSLAAASYVESRLKAIGVSEVYIQEFPVIQPVTAECSLSLVEERDGKTTETQVLGKDVYARLQDRLVIYPVRPNILQASITPAEGLTGKTVYVGDGQTGNYPELPEGKIVVIDFDCLNRWQTAFALGARAVVFIGPPLDATGQDAKPAEKLYQHVNVPANLPRFYVPAEVADKLQLRSGSRQITIRAACRWERRQGRNVIGVIRGSNSPFRKGHTGQAEAVLLAAQLDSYSEVPDLAPGARDAANAALLLRTAKTLTENLPKRDVLLCFFDGEAQNHLGSSAFYGQTGREKSKVEAKYTLDERMEMHQQEHNFRDSMLTILNRSIQRSQLVDQAGALRAANQQVPQELARNIDELALLSQATKDLSKDYHNEVIEVLRVYARSLETRVMDNLWPMLLKRRELEEERQRLAREGKQFSDEKKSFLDAVSLEADQANLEDMAWNNVQRSLHQQKDVESQQALDEILASEKDLKRRELLRKESLSKYRLLLDYSKKMTLRRLGELDALIHQTEQGKVLRDAVGPTADSIVMHVCLNVGDALPNWTIIHGDDVAPPGEDRVGTYKGIFSAIERICKNADFSSAVPDFNLNAIGTIFPNRLFAPAMFTDNGGIARTFGVWNISVMTAMDRLPRQGQPVDTVGALNVTNILSQANQVVPFLSRFIDDPELQDNSKVKPVPRYVEPAWNASRLTSAGPSVQRVGSGSAMADLPVPDAILAVIPKSATGPWNAALINKTPPGFVYPMIVGVDANGNFTLPAHSQSRYNASICFAASFGNGLAQGETPAGRGLISAVTNTQSLTGGADLSTVSIIIFNTVSQTAVGYGYNRASIASIAMLSLSTAKFREDRSLTCELEDIFTVYAPSEAKGMKVFNNTGMVLLNNDDTAAGFQGRGLSMEDPFSHPVVPLMTAGNLLNLDKHRLRMLRDSRINQESIELLNGKATDAFDDARLLAKLNTPAAEATSRPTTAPASQWVEKYVGDLSASSGYSRTVYTPLIGVMNDLVTAVVLLLLLAMPFAYALERLLIGTPHIYRQIGWFMAFFILTFIVLYLVNPAFKIASTPIIIFLAFAIILLSALVIFIMIRKLQVEIRKIQGLATTVHSADVSRLSTMMAAVNMGISTMRRRPLRTLLTALTVVLLTFTILTFASFGSGWGVRQTFEGQMQGTTPRVLLRHQLRSPIPNGIVDMLRGTFQGQAEVVPRYWVSPTAQDVKDARTSDATLTLGLATTDLKSFANAAAALGIDPRDVQREPELERLLLVEPTENEQSRRLSTQQIIIERLNNDGLFMPLAVYDKWKAERPDLAMKPGDPVLLAGRNMKFAGIVSDRMAGHTMLDGSSILPVDYEGSSAGASENFIVDTTSTSMLETAAEESAQFVHYSADSVVVVSADTARKMTDSVRAITTYPLGDTSHLQDMANRTANLSLLPTYVGDRGGVYRLIFTSLTQASGLRNLLIPVILGGLIVFATMLGSVSDREREIYTFSSLGLAPPHIAGLFFAEAAVYAVVGGMGGYLLGQIIARVLGIMAEHGLVNVPAMNYSSTNAIFTILIVMGTVLISTIYPAVKASRSANPGIQRAWKIPTPKDNLYDLVFPFTVSSYDITGVVSFLNEHFDNYRDASLGEFATNATSVFRQEGSDLLGFGATISLAPFDLGVNQRFALLSRPSEIKGIDEVRILIHRISGAQGDWRRANRVFINGLRKQLLIWRSLPNDLMDRYRQKTLDAWNDLPVRRIDADNIAAVNDDESDAARRESVQ